ncbi:MAG: TIGR01777 family protein [Planctomycetes bacterium]|nr:TIGR01777 family protein [Planctomycetota bacterium]
MRVFITGGTGLVGSHLIKKLRDRGDQVVVLTRRPDVAKPTFGDGVTIVDGDPMVAGAWQDAVADCDAVVNLAGEGLFNQRWSDDFKALFRSSRVRSTENIVAALGKKTALDASGSSRRVLVNGSAIGYYGPHGDEELTEASLAGNDFLASVCMDWERAAEPAMKHGVRVVYLRTGIVLEANGGALAKMLTPFKFFVGGPIAGGAQYMSWIHIEDEVGLLLFALDHAEITGPLNATAPNPMTNYDFSKALGSVLGRPSFMPTPGFMLRLAMGEVADILTTGQRVLPKKATAAGYEFQFPELGAALVHLLIK